MLEFHQYCIHDLVLIFSVCGDISAENAPLKRHTFTTLQHPHSHRNAQHTLQHPHRSAQHTLQRKSSHSAQNQRVLTMSELHQMLKKQRSGERDTKLQVDILDSLV